MAMASPTGFPLHRPELFEVLSEGDRLLLAAMEEHRVFGAHDVVIPAGEAHEWVYRLRTGWLCRSRTRSDGGRQIIAVLLPGDLFGIKSMLTRQQPDSVECLTDAAVNLVGQARLRALAAAQPDVALRLMFQLAEDERKLHNWVTGLGRADARERVAAMLLELRGRLRRLNLISGNSYRLPMTQQQLGDYLGLTVVHVNRVLRSLREEGLAIFRNGTVVLQDVARLQRIAGPMQDVFERQQVEFGGSAA